MEKKIMITLVKSLVSCDQRQRDTANSLGLRKIRKHVVHKDSSDIRGKIEKIKHLVKVEEAV